MDEFMAWVEDDLPTLAGGCRVSAREAIGGERLGFVVDMPADGEYTSIKKRVVGLAQKTLSEDGVGYLPKLCFSAAASPDSTQIILNMVIAPPDQSSQTIS